MLAKVRNPVKLFARVIQSINYDLFYYIAVKTFSFAAFVAATVRYYYARTIRHFY